MNRLNLQFDEGIYREFSESILAESKSDTTSKLKSAMLISASLFTIGWLAFLLIDQYLHIAIIWIGSLIASLYYLISGLNNFFTTRKSLKKTIRADEEQIDKFLNLQNSYCLFDDEIILYFEDDQEIRSFHWVDLISIIEKRQFSFFFFKTLDNFLFLHPDMISNTEFQTFQDLAKSKIEAEKIISL